MESHAKLPLLPLSSVGKGAEGFLKHTGSFSAWKHKHGKAKCFLLALTVAF